MAERIDLSSQCAADAVAITPSDVTVVTYVGIYVGVSGDVAIKGRCGTAVTLKNVPAGTFIPVNVKAVMVTGTTATNLVGLVQ